MKTGSKIIISSIALIAILAIWIIFSYNGLVSSRNDVEEHWGQVESKLQRRNDLIPNLVNSVKGSMKQEQEVFGKIADARSKLSGATTVNEQVQANQEMDSALSRLLVVVENYPELKSNQNVTALMDELGGTENRISVERDRYNTAVKNYTTKTQSFPRNLIAGMFGFKKFDYFKAVEGAETAPSVDLE